MSAAFYRHFANDGTAFVPMECVSAPEVIDAIQGAGGVVSLAHPGRTLVKSIEGIVDNLVEVRMDTIEMQCPHHAAPTKGYSNVSVEDPAALDEEHGLLQTGGADRHGPSSGKFRIGEVRVSEVQLDEL